MVANTHDRSIWSHADFRRLWMAQTISEIGSQISFLALPLVATIILDASPLQMGILTAASSLPSLLLGLHTGALVDRRSKRPLLLAADIGRALLLLVIPLAWLFHMLSIELLFAVAFLGGFLALVFHVAYQTFLLTILDRRRIVDGNSKLELSRTAAEIVGPGLAGWLIHLLTAPIAIVFDAGSYVLSAICIRGIRTREGVPAIAIQPLRLRQEIGDGVRAVLGDPRMRTIVGSSGLLELFNAMLDTVSILYLVRTLEIGPELIGIIFTAGSIGFVVGAILPNVLARHLGIGRATVLSISLVGFSDLLIPLAHGSMLVVVPLLIVAQMLFGLGLTVFKVNRSSLRQALIPLEMQGRATATMRMLSTGLIPLGAILGGVIGEWIGIRHTLVIAASGELLAAFWIWRSPLRTLHGLPGEPVPSPVSPVG